LIEIRPETLADYAAIARVNARAFDTHPNVALLIDLHRHRPRFDPELSLVAEVGGRIVGHVLFSPQTIRLLGQNVDVVNLSPLAVDPDYQRQGVGSALVLEGHRIVQAKGYPLSFLVGHSAYYPRLGYLTRAYGGRYDSISMRVATADFPAGELETRTPAEADIPALRALWLHEEGGVDFSIDPGGELLGWLSPHPAISARVYTRAGEIVGYARVMGTTARYFLARDGETARQMARMIGAEVELPLHPYSASTGSLGDPEYGLADAAMACPLAPSPFDDYYAQVQADTRLGGRSIWGVEFDIS
jgi:predicted N-acetyltransferase YhbS